MLTAVVLSRNEEKNIKECLESLLWCGEILVIDDNSTDSTRKIAERLGAKVYKRDLENDFAKQRNFGLEKAKGDWVFFVDADERVSDKLREEIKTAIAGSSGSGIVGYWIKRRDVLWGKEAKHGEAGNACFLRLAKKNAGRWKRSVHEVWQVDGETAELSNFLMHYPHRTISEFLLEVNRYSTLHAIELAKEGKRSNIIKIIFWPKLKFLHNWILKRGFLDGTSGFVLAIMMSFHSYLSWAKLWLIQNRQQSTNDKQQRESNT